MGNMATRMGAAFGVAAIVTAGTAIARASGNSYTGQVPPEISCTDWINSKPLTLAELKGDVVLLEFWSTG